MIEIIQDFFSEWGVLVLFCYLILAFVVKKLLGSEITKIEKWDIEQIEYYKNQNKKPKDESDTNSRTN